MTNNDSRPVRAPQALMDFDLGTTDTPSIRTRAFVSPDPRFPSVARKLKAWVERAARTKTLLLRHAL